VDALESFADRFLRRSYPARLDVHRSMRRIHLPIGCCFSKTQEHGQVHQAIKRR